MQTLRRPLKPLRRTSVIRSVIDSSFLLPSSSPSQSELQDQVRRANQQPSINEAQVTADAALIQPPIGAMMGWAGASDPTDTKWLLCDGRTVLIESYPELYTAIGTTWNTGGEAADAFRLPDLRSRVAVGAGQGTSLTNRAVAAKSGSESVVLTTPQLATHSHLSATGNSTHDHGASTGDNTHSHGAATGDNIHSHGGATGNNVHYHGGDSYVTANTFTNIILNSGGSFNVVHSINQLDNTFTDFSDPHSHTISSVTHDHTISSVTHNHSISSSIHNHEVYDAGAGASHENMPPWLAMHQIIRALP